MKKKLSFLSIVMAIFAFAILTSCEKEAGPQGPAGADGNANVHSQIFSNAGCSDQGGGVIYEYNLADADVTQAIIDNGSVDVYILNGTSQWYALPYTFPINGTYGLSTIFSFTLGQVKVEMVHTDYSSFTNPGARSFKVVCTEGN